MRSAIAIGGSDAQRKIDHALRVLEPFGGCEIEHSPQERAVDPVFVVTSALAVFPAASPRDGTLSGSEGVAARELRAWMRVQRGGRQSPRDLR